MSGSCVLMYHAISDHELPCDEVGSDDAIYTVRPETFRSQLTYMKKRAIAAQSLAKHLAAGRHDSRHVVFTFDDGNRTDAMVALPLLQEFGFSATFFITTDWIGNRGFVTKEDIRELHAAGMELGSHGHTHRYFNEMSTNELAKELALSTATLSEITGSPVLSLGAPGGRLHPQLETAARRNRIETICTSRFGLLTADSSKLSIPRIPVLRATKSEEFAKIVGCNSRYYRRKNARYVILQNAKKILGNAVYERFRNRVLKNP